MKIIALKLTRWITTIIALIFSVDAVLAIYKTIAFRGGIESKFDFYAALLICFALLVVTVLTGLGTLTGAVAHQFWLSERSALNASLVVGVVFLLMNTISVSEWLRQVLVSKSESVVICTILSGVLLLLTMDEKSK